jgi:hypothetical protein
MNNALSYRFFKKLQEDQFSLIYTGEFDDELTATLLRINENYVEDPPSLKKKLSFLIVECFQNILRHAEKPAIINKTNNKPSMFMIRSVGNMFHITSTNLIDNTKKEELVQKLKNFNKLTKEELKDVYLNALTNNEFTSKGGGGLGLIEMARKSDYPIQFAFDFVNFYFSNFFIQLSITGNNYKENISLINVQSNVELYKDLLEEDILLIRKGDFSQESILPLLKLVETGMQGKQKLPPISKKMFYVMVELLQNISKHGYRTEDQQEGIFIISLKNNRYTINTGNYIDNQKVESLKKHLDSLAGMNENELREIYKNNLINQGTGIKGSAGVGLIDISKYGSEKLKYNFTPINETTSFYSLSITV